MLSGVVVNSAPIGRGIGVREEVDRSDYIGAGLL